MHTYFCLGLLCRSACCGLLVTLPLGADAHADGPVLQYFESPYEFTLRRMPDIFMAGYGALWLPPTGRAQGGQSVGYDVFDRFDLDHTFYGNREQLTNLIREAHKAGLRIYADIVLNHNAYANLATPGFVAQGDYPGFALTLPEDIDGDFHGAFEAGDLNGRINGGLMDIAQEKNHRFVRHPVDPTDPANIANEPALEANRSLYPDIDHQSPPALGDTSADRHTPSGFNLDTPAAGDPVVENANDLLARYCRWMIEVIGFDGFRLDAAKHVPTFFWNDVYDPAVAGIGPGGSAPYSFGEVIEHHNFDLLRSYVRKDGFGNRDILDFPLYFTVRDILNARGFGDMRLLERASVDGADGNPNDGTLGVTFVQNHDAHAPPPASDNLAYAHILTRTGYPIVYFNAGGFGGGRDFPEAGRGDALGGEFGDILTTLVEIHNEYARGPHITRFADSDVYIYERDQALLVGLNDNEAFAADRTIQTSFPAGTELVELVGNPGASDRLLVGPDGRANITIPRNQDGLGYAMWGPRAPQGSESGEALVLSPVASMIGADGPLVPSAERRLTPVERVTAASATLTLTLEDQGLDDNALLRIDGGTVNIVGTQPVPSGEFAGFQPFTESDPGASGVGVYAAALDLAQLDPGLHYIEVIAFLKRDPWQPPIFQTFRKVIEVDR